MLLARSDGGPSSPLLVESSVALAKHGKRGEFGMTLKKMSSRAQVTSWSVLDSTASEDLRRSPSPIPRRTEVSFC